MNGREAGIGGFGRERREWEGTAEGKGRGGQGRVRGRVAEEETRWRTGYGWKRGAARKTAQEKGSPAPVRGGGERADGERSARHGGRSGV